MIRIIFILILTLSFQPWTKADHIRDFQIEGMSIGDSALDFYSKKQLKKFMKDYYPKSKKFYLLENDISSFQNYDSVQFAFKKKDKEFIIYGLSGSIFYEKNVNKCLSKKNKIENELNSIFKDSEIKHYGEWIREDDPSGKSKQLAQTQYILKNGINKGKIL